MNKKIGLSFHRIPQDDALPEIANYGIARLLDYGPTIGGASLRCYWYGIESRNGMRWDATDRFVNHHSAAGRDIIFTLCGTPAFLSSRPTEKCAMWDGAAAPPSDITRWIAFCRNVALRYSGRVKYYEIWNEVNMQEFWTGTLDELVSMVIAAEHAIHDVDPSALILAPSVTGMVHQSTEIFYDEMLGRTRDSVDLGNIHAYNSNRSGDIERDAAGVAADVTKFVAIGHSHGIETINSEFCYLSAVRFADLPKPSKRKALIEMFRAASPCVASVWYDGDHDGNFGMTESDRRMWNVLADSGYI